jgi:hypothetical protein
MIFTVTQILEVPVTVNIYFLPFPDFLVDL